MAITAADVNKLRKQTGLGLMDCKKALVETDGDFEKAIDLLRKKGQKIAAKRGDNEASEGYVIAKTTEDGKNDAGCRYNNLESKRRRSKIQTLYTSSLLLPTMMMWWR